MYKRRSARIGNPVVVGSSSGGGGGGGGGGGRRPLMPSYWRCLCRVSQTSQDPLSLCLRGQNSCQTSQNCCQSDRQTLFFVDWFCPGTDDEDHTGRPWEGKCVCVCVGGGAQGFHPPPSNWRGRSWSRSPGLGVTADTCCRKTVSHPILIWFKYIKPEAQLAFVLSKRKKRCQCWTF